MNEKLIKIQTELNCPKSQRNNFGNYNYRSCEDIFEAVKPLLKENGLTLRLTDELVNIGERYYIKATAILSDGTETIENVAYAREEETKKGQDGSQITGASSSYARKYALNGLFLIDDVKDSDSTNTGEITTKEEARNLKLTFGKHAGRTIGELVDEESSYINYLFQHGTPDIKKAITLLTGIVDVPLEEQKDKLGEMPITEAQKQQIKDKYSADDIKNYLIDIDKRRLGELTYEEARVWLSEEGI